MFFGQSHKQKQTCFRPPETKLYDILDIEGKTFWFKKYILMFCLVQQDFSKNQLWECLTNPNTGEILNNSLEQIQNYWLW